MLVSIKWAFLPLLSVGSFRVCFAFRTLDASGNHQTPFKAPNQNPHPTCPLAPSEPSCLPLLILSTPAPRNILLAPTLRPPDTNHNTGTAHHLSPRETNPALRTITPHRQPLTQPSRIHTCTHPALRTMLAPSVQPPTSALRTIALLPALRPTLLPALRTPMPPHFSLPARRLGDD